MDGEDSRLQSQRRWIVHLVTRALRAAGANEIEYDADNDALQLRTGDGSPLTVYLTKLFGDCLEASADDRAVHIDRFVAAVTAPPDLPTGWDEAAGRLRPVLRPATYGLESEQAERPLAREFQPFLNEMVVMDEPTRIAYVNLSMLHEWGVAESVVFDRARANLAARAVFPQVEDGPPDGSALFRLVESGDVYWASHLLLDGWLNQMVEVVGGRPVVFLPDTEGLTVVADEPPMIGSLLTMVEKQYLEASRPVSPQAYTVDEAGRVVPYTVPAGDPMWNAVHRSEVLFASQEYGAQQEQHDDIFDGFVASLKVKERPDGGVRSVTVWGEDVFGVLPRADYVAFVSEDGEHFTVPWDVVAREAGLVPEPGWSPIRYRVQSWPDPRVVARLRAAATSL